MSSLLFSHIEKYVPLSDKDREVISSLFISRRFRKKQYMLQQGEICRQETFIIKGCARTYELDEEGNEHVLQFGLEGWWVGNLYSFLTETPSAYLIDCLEDCETLQVGKKDLETIYRQVPQMERFFRLIIQNAFITLQQRTLTSLSKSATERYDEFLARYPQIEQRVPDHQVASYLGIKPQSLSRIRSRKASK